MWCRQFFAGHYWKQHEYWQTQISKNFLVFFSCSLSFRFVSSLIRDCESDIKKRKSQVYIVDGKLHCMLAKGRVVCWRRK